MKLYRAMKIAADGLPEVGPTARSLGVRRGDQLPKPDVLAIQPVDLIAPETGGMSVSPNDPTNLPRNRRPPDFGGVGKDPVWQLDETELPSELKARQDKPDHAMIEPVAITSLAEYESALASTRTKWRLVEPKISGDPS